VLALAPGGAFAASEVGDTGELPASAQEVGPAGPLDSIEGTIAGSGDRDVYKVCLTGGKTFSATTTGGRASFDTQLFLLNADGRGAYANDDSLAPQSTLPANNALTPDAAGVYYLAISAYNADPDNVGGMIFPDRGAGVQGPTGHGGDLPMASWTGVTFSSGGSYAIGLTGTKSCIPPDETAPAIDLRSPADGAQFELGQTVLADYSCTDEPGGSGVASCSGDAPNGLAIDTSSLGDKHFTVVALDKRGNRSERMVSYSVVDRTDPTVDLRTPPEGAEYVRGQQVEADFSCDDTGGSGLILCGGDVSDGQPIDTSSLGEKSFSVTARDGSGNATTATHRYRVVDRTDPTVDLRTPANGASYERGAPVAADYSCGDEQGGSGVASCSGDVPSGQPLDTATLGHKSFSVTARDGAGNRHTETHEYTVVDGAGPSISLRSPADGAVYSLDDVVAADYDCADEDGGSGVASCNGTVADGAPVDTSDFGEHSFTVSSSDRAGNTSSKTVTYRVQFNFEGFFAPLVNRPRVNVVKAGSVVPITFSLDGNQGREVFATGYPRSVDMTCGSHADLDGGTRVQSPGHTKLRYKPKRDLYIYLWKTDKRWEGDCRQFVLKLDDGSYHRADFRFPAKKSHGGHGHDNDD
jgi:hypothetical protein